MALTWNFSDRLTAGFLGFGFFFLLCFGFFVLVFLFYFLFPFFFLFWKGSLLYWEKSAKSGWFHTLKAGSAGSGQSRKQLSYVALAAWDFILNIPGKLTFELLNMFSFRKNYLQYCIKFWKSHLTLFLRNHGNHGIPDLKDLRDNLAQPFLAKHDPA